MGLYPERVSASKKANRLQAKHAVGRPPTRISNRLCWRGHACRTSDMTMLVHRSPHPTMPTVSELENNADETVGRATHNGQPEPAVAPVVRRQVKSARKLENLTRTRRETRELRQRQRTPAVQTHFAGFDGAYPGYAALH